MKAGTSAQLSVDDTISVAKLMGINPATNNHPDKSHIFTW